MTFKFAPSAILLASSLFGQAVLQTGPPRFGNILYPGGSPLAAPAPRLGSLIPNHGQYGGGYFSPPARPNHPRSFDANRTLVVPYAFPVYFNDYGGYNYAPQPPVTVVVPQQQQNVPTVIINQTFASSAPEPVEEDAPTQSSVRIYRTPVRPAAPPEPPKSPREAVADQRATIYLIAYKDSSIHSAIGYWTEGDTLHYVTQQGTVNRISLDQVDKPLSDQLNSERKVDFQLKAR